MMFLSATFIAAQLLLSSSFFLFVLFIFIFWLVFALCHFVVFFPFSFSSSLSRSVELGAPEFRTIDRK